MKKSLIKSQWFLTTLILFSAGSWAFGFVTRYSGFIGASRSVKIYDLGLALLIFGILAAIVISQLAHWMRGNVTPRHILLVLIVSAVLAVIYNLLFFTPPPFPENHRLEIYPLGISNELAAGQNVQVESIRRVTYPEEKRITLSPEDMDKEAGWQISILEIYYWEGGSIGSLVHDAFFQGGMDIVMSTGPEMGMAVIRWDSEERILDLYHPEAGSITESFAPALDWRKADRTRKLLLAGSLVAEFLGITVALSLIGLFILTFLKTRSSFRNKGFVLGSMGFLASLLFISISFYQPVRFADPNLEKAVAESIHRQGKPVYRHQLLGVVSLDASRRGVTRLEGIENLKNLVELDLQGNLIRDITPLIMLKRLNTLNLRGNYLEDLSPLTNLTLLRYLNLHSNTTIHSIKPLEGLTNLEILILRNVNVGEEVGILGNFPELIRLNLRNTGIKDTSALGDLMTKGALQDDGRIKASLDLRDNPLRVDTTDAYASVRPYWENISSRVPFWLPNYGTLDPPVFFHDAGFYPDPFQLELATTDPSANIHYTLDGSEPTLKSPIYNGPIKIDSLQEDPNTWSYIENTSPIWMAPNGEVRKATIVRAKIFKVDGSENSLTVTRTFFVDGDSPRRYTLPVVSLVTDPGNLFDYETGIYVMGRLYDELYDPQLDIESRWQEANYTQRGGAWERPVSVEYFESDGSRALVQYAGMRIHGKVSRTFRQKTLRILAKNINSPEGRFAFQFFPKQINMVDGQPITEYRTILLRNSGKDQESTMFRDALMQSLVSHTILDSQAYRPVIVFIDGEYWGIHNLRERQDEYYLAGKYLVDPAKVTIFDGNLYLFRGEPGDGQPYIKMMKYAQENDLTDPSIYEHLQTMMDVDNFILYQNAQVYSANCDMFFNNIKFWRVRTDRYDPGAPYGQDGRWRWLLFDTDSGFGLKPFCGGYSGNTLERAVDSLNNQNLLPELLESETFRIKFINGFADQLNTSFREERVLAQIDLFQAVLEPEMAEHIRRWRTMEDSIEGWRKNVDELREFASNRPRYVRQHLAERFGLEGISKLTIESDPILGLVQVNSIVISDEMPGVEDPRKWSGLYFNGIPIEVTALPNPGYQFAGWEGDLKDGIADGESSLQILLDGDRSLKAVFTRLP